MPRRWRDLTTNSGSWCSLHTMDKFRSDAQRGNERQRANDNARIDQVLARDTPLAAGVNRILRNADLVEVLEVVPQVGHRRVALGRLAPQRPPDHGLQLGWQIG